jgi:hypothetical protein
MLTLIHHIFLQRISSGIIFYLFLSRNNVLFTNSWGVSRLKKCCACAYLIKHYAIKSRSIDPRILDIGTSWSWVVSFTPWPLYPRERAPDAHWIGGWLGPRTGLDDVESRKVLPLPGLELRPLGRPASSQSFMFSKLIRLHSSSCTHQGNKKKRTQLSNSE